MHLEFNDRDFVVIQIRLEQFPQGIINKLHARSASPYKILKKINLNVYVKLIYLWILGLVLHFNFSDIEAYKDPPL